MGGAVVRDWQRPLADFAVPGPVLAAIPKTSDRRLTETNLTTNTPSRDRNYWLHDR